MGTTGKRSSDELTTGEPYIVVSADAHASPDDFEHFLSYVDPADRDAVAAAGELSSAAISMFGGVDQGEIDDADPVRATAARRLAGMGVDIAAAHDWLERYGVDWVVPGDGDGRRTEVLEEQGIHAEVTYSGSGAGRRPSPAAMFARRQHGARASSSCGRRCTRTTAGWSTSARPRPDGAPAASRSTSTTWIAPSHEIEWAREAGLFGGVMLPAMSTTSGLRGYTDDYFDPFWSACEDNGMVVNLHTGASGVPTDARQLYDVEHGGLLGLYEVFVFTRRPLWFMIFGGVFDRHPDLQVVVAENGVQWLPSLIRDMEQFFDTHGGAPVRTSLTMRPREYFDRHVFLGGSLMQRDEAEMRDEIGVDRLMWGADYPHLEGAAPVHRETLRHVFGGMPEADLRRILGLNAIDLWGFDEPTAPRGRRPRRARRSTTWRRRLELDEIPPTFSWSLARPVPAGRGSALSERR